MGVNEQSAFNALVEKYYKEMQEIQSNRSITESVRDNKIDALQRKYQDQFSYFGTSILCNAGEELGEDDGLLDSDPVPTAIHTKIKANKCNKGVNYTS